MPHKENKGKPPDRYSPEGKTRYAIAKYVSTHRLSTQCQAFVNQMAIVAIPNIVDEALKDLKWVNAMKMEMEALKENRTWDIVTLPKGQKPVGCKWIFIVKHNVNETIDRYKARLVAKGYTQTHGVDY